LQSTVKKQLTLTIKALQNTFKKKQSNYLHHSTRYSVLHNFDTVTIIATCILNSNDELWF